MLVIWDVDNARPTVDRMITNPSLPRLGNGA